MIEATSCGGVVIFRGKILLLYKNIKNKYEGWVLPKGTVEAGETHEETALREVLEESGSKAYIVDYIGRSEYSFTVPEDVVEKAKMAILEGASIVTDTQMAKAGINKKALAKYGGEVYCFMSDEDVAEKAKEQGSTRAVASMDKAAEMGKPLIFAIGNAPTALVRLYELIEEKKISPYLIIGVPVGFVNVVQSKELIMDTDAPYIVARGRKGGSNIAACICNALLYMIDNERDYWK